MTTAPTLYGPGQFPFTNGQFVREIMQPDGKRLVAGYASGNLALARYNTDGTLDLPFGGGDGKVTVDFGTPSDTLLNASLRPDGKILLFAMTSGNSNDYQVVLARLNPDGTLDSTFADNGHLLTGVGRNPGFGIVTSVLTDGRIHVTGDALDGSGTRGYEYDANGRNAVDRLAKVTGTIEPAALSSSTAQIGPSAADPFASLSAGAEAMGPFQDTTGALYPQDVGLQAGQSYEVGLPDGTGRIVYWGDGTSLSVSDTVTSATHTYDTAGTYTPTATGLWSNLAGQMSFNPAGGTGTQYVVRSQDANLTSGDIVDTDNHDLVVQDPTADFTTVRQSVLDGYSRSPDDTKTGIISTAGQSSGDTILELMDNKVKADEWGLGLSDWPRGSGNTVSPNAIIGKYTYFGDDTLDGQVTGDDYMAVDVNLGTTPPAGIAILCGDTNFSDTVTGDDFTYIDANLGKGTSAPLSASAADAPLTLDTVNVAAPITGSLDAPANVVATASPDGEEADITVSWDAQDNVTHYTVERATDSSFIDDVRDYTVDGSTTWYSDTDFSGVSVGQTLYYHVQAANDAEQPSDWSDYANADAPAVLPAAPDSLYAVAVPGDTGQPDNVQLTWGESSGSTSSFQIQRDTSPDFSNPTTLPAVTPSSMSTTVDMHFDPNPPPPKTNPPDTYQYEPQYTSVSLAGDLRFTSFSSDDLTLVMGADEQVTLSAGSGTDYLYTLPDDAILFRNTDNAWGTWDGGTVELKSQTAPADFVIDNSYYNPGAQVQDFEAGGFQTRDYTQGVSEDEMRSRGWVGTDGLAHAQVAWIGDNGWCSATVSGSLSNYLDTLPSSGTYYYRITATNSDGSSQTDSGITIAPPSSATLAQPTDVLYDQLDDGSYSIDWTGLSNNEGGFAVWRATTSDFSAGAVKLYTATHGGSEYVDATAQPGATYYYRVAAVNPANPSTSAPAVPNAAQSTSPLYFLAPDGRFYNADQASNWTFSYGSAIHVYLRPAWIKQFGALTSRFTWDFNDAYSTDEYNIVHGYNAAHIYDVLPSGNVGTIQLSVETPTPTGVAHHPYSLTVSLALESALTQIKVSSSGDFNGTGGTYSLEGAISKLNDIRAGTHQNVEIAFHRGEIFTLTDTDSLSGAIDLRQFQNVLVTSYGSAALPILSFKNQRTDNGYSPFFKMSNDNFDNQGNLISEASRNITIRNMDMRSDVPADAPKSQASPNVMDLPTTGSDLAVQYGQWHNIYGLSATSTVAGLLLQGNTSYSAAADQLKGYMLYIAGATNVVALGNTANASAWESCMRLANPGTYVVVSYNTLHTDSKSALRFESSLYGWAEHNDISGAANWIGPLPGEDGDPSQRSTFLVFDSNVLEDRSATRDEKNPLQLAPGLNQAVLRNNIFIGSSRLNVRGNPYTYHTDANGNKYLVLDRRADDIANNVWVVNNTRLDPNTYQFVTFAEDFGVKDLYIRLKNFHFANNLDAVSSTTQTRFPDGVVLNKLTGVTPAPRWADELKGSLGDGDASLGIPIPPSQWWVADNVWGPDQLFQIDTDPNDATKGATGEYTFWNASVLPSPGTDIKYLHQHNGVVVDTTVGSTQYIPLTSAVEIGSRNIAGDPDMEVAAWDFYGKLRPQPSDITKVTVGAVERNPIA